MLAGKVWGSTQQIIANGVFEFHRIEIKKDGYCSKHKHAHKFNGFFLESGKLEIHVFKNDYDLEDVTILEPGDYTEVGPGEYHFFKALDDCVAFEIYWAKLDHNDIVRETVGGSS
jgi:mannose-6-phosphate isomerase-like protein (cupin superfamily)